MTEQPMTMVKMPVLNRDEVRALRSILRLVLLRDLGSVLQAQTTGDYIDKLLAVLSPIEAYGMLDEPLIGAETLMDYHGRTDSELLMSDRIFAAYRSIAALPIEDFQTEDSEWKSVVEYIGQHRPGLVKAFANARDVDLNAESNAVKTKNLLN